MSHSCQSVSQHPYLGVELSSTLDWSNHINSKANTANQTLGFLRRNLGTWPESIKELAYRTLVRPHLEYASHVSLDGQAHNANRSCTKAICTICEEMFAANRHNWINLTIWISRRKAARLTMLHKTIRGESALEIPSYVKRRNCQLRSYHKDKFIELKPNTEAYRNSFYCRTIQEWNSLPSNIIDMVGGALTCSSNFN